MHCVDDKALALTIKENIKTALTEDLGEGDVTSHLIPASKNLNAALLARDTFVLAGGPWFDASFHALDDAISIQWRFEEGQWVNKGEVIATVSGNARHILSAERTALNFLQLLSGVASTVRQYQDAVQGKVILLDTRKTIPGLRLAQKYAVRCGGGRNHRLGLYDAFLIKENHIKAQGSISKAIGLAKQMREDLKIEVEVETLEELEEAIQAKPDVIMLDNFDIAMIKEAVRINRAHDLKLEASGNITLDNIAAIAETGVDYISIGRLTKTVKAVDLSLLIK